jgi:hypothetical protein
MTELESALAKLEITAGCIVLIDPEAVNFPEAFEHIEIPKQLGEIAVIPVRLCPGRSLKDSIALVPHEELPTLIAQLQAAYIGRPY